MGGNKVNSTLRIDLSDFMDEDQCKFCFHQLKHSICPICEKIEGEICQKCYNIFYYRNSKYCKICDSICFRCNKFHSKKIKECPYCWICRYCKGRYPPKIKRCSECTNIGICQFCGHDFEVFCSYCFSQCNKCNSIFRKEQRYCSFCQWSCKYCSIILSFNEPNEKNICGSVICQQKNHFDLFGYFLAREDNTNYLHYLPKDIGIKLAYFFRYN